MSSPSDHVVTVPELVERAARLHPGSELADAAEARLRHTDLPDTVRRLARDLRAAGVGDFDRVAVYAAKTTPAVATVLGICAARAIAVPVNPVLRERHVRHIIDDSTPRLVVVDAAHRPLMEAAMAEGSHRCDIVDVDELFHPKAPAATAPLPQPLESDPAILFYTSGSTGWPKGVLVSHRNITAGAESVAQVLDLAPDDRVQVLLPMGFDAGFNQIVSALAVGASVVLSDFLLPRTVAEIAERFQVTSLTGVPPLWFRLLDAGWSETARRRLRQFANTGGHMPKATLSRLRQLFPAARPFMMYGFTEAFRATCLPPEEIERRPGSIGRAIPGVEIAVLDAAGHPVPAGGSGELVQFGPLVSLGYWNAPAANAERFRTLEVNGVPRRAALSGDTVTIDAEGFLTFVGRGDEMIKTSGYRVSPSEIEDIAFSSGLVAGSVATGIADAELGQVIHLAVVAAPGTTLEPAALLGYFRAEVASHMVPKRIVVLDSLPQLANGKVDRAAVRRALAGDAATEGG